MSRQVLFHLKYDLNRRQRLLPHLFLWLPMLPLLIALCLLPPLVFKSLWTIPLVLLALWFTKGFWIGLIQIVAHPVQPMDIEVEENGLGFLADGQRWYISLDGVIKFDKIRPDTWTLYHHNGTVINIPAPAIGEAEVETLRSAIQTAKDRANQASSQRQKPQEVI